MCDAFLYCFRLLAESYEILGKTKPGAHRHRPIPTASGIERWADWQTFQSESNPDPQKLNPIQSWSAKFLKIISPIQPDPPM